MEQIKNLITSINNSSDDYDEKYMKFIFDSDDYGLPLKKKTLELRNIVLVVRSIFSDSNKYYSQLFLDGFCKN